MSVIYVTGSSRSGTTMMSRVLNQNPLVFSFNELHFFEQLVEPAALNKGLEYDEALALADRLLGIQYEGFLLYKKKGIYKIKAKMVLDSIKNNLYTPIAVYINFINYITHENGKQTGCDQTPRNVLYINEILSNVPGAKIICMIRDPRAVVLSQKYKWKRRFLGASSIPLIESIRSYFNYHPYIISKLWMASTRQSVKWEHNENVYLLKFEDLLEKPEKAIQDICIFLNINYHPSMLKIPHVGSSNKKDASNKLEISASTKAVWKNGALSKAEINICQQITGEYMNRLNYNKEVFPVPYLSLLWQIIIFPFKTIISLLFNLNRVKNLKQAILRRL